MLLQEAVIKHRYNHHRWMGEFSASVNIDKKKEKCDKTAFSSYPRSIKTPTPRRTSAGDGEFNPFYGRKRIVKKCLF